MLYGTNSFLSNRVNVTAAPVVSVSIWATTRRTTRGEESTTCRPTQTPPIAEREKQQIQLGDILM